MASRAVSDRAAIEAAKEVPQDAGPAAGTLKLRAGTVPGEVRGEREVSSSAARHGRRLRRRRHFLAIPPLRGGTPGSVAEARQRCREPHARGRPCCHGCHGRSLAGFSTEQHRLTRVLRRIGGRP
ncbi:MAG: hypothetical protein HYZ92_05505 [Candidatus Omnitrophica bacterium]|nr:hypothetical protein [Candidatus Omnitrophota bacterium]